MKDLLQDFFGRFQFHLLCADLFYLDNACFSFPKSHEYASKVTWAFGIFCSALARPFAGTFGIS
jgi:hypothetical protein